MALVPSSDAEKKASYLYTFKKWIASHPEQARYFCEHGAYCGADLCLNRTSFGCEECRAGG